MTSQRHDRVSKVFLAAVELPESERSAFLDQACPGDPILRQDVEDLLSRDAHPAAVDRPVVSQELRRAIEGPGKPEHLPSQIGSYEIMDVLGRGGMGTVYRARQRNPDRVVALKVVNAGVVSRLALRRFEFEAHLLGQLQHPGIAQIFEAGLAHDSQGRLPYFAMELIDGPALTDYADTTRLDIRQRLLLLNQVCEAVQHAHQKGIIHRDLKPANILVEGDGQSKILDFGVARTTDSDMKTTTIRTHAGQIIGTVPYMSPEQIAGDPDELDTRTDVYSLGVIAYELIAGRPPHELDNTTVAEAARIIRDERPARLSSLNCACRGDVETIIAKALEKNKELRYATVSDFSGDIKRFLQDEPIFARSPSVMYQFSRFARRNRGLVASIAAAFVILILGVAGTSLGLVEAGRKRRLAETRLTRAETAEARARQKQAEAEAVSLFIMRVITTPRPNQEGRDTTVIEALDVARREVDSAFADQPKVRAAVHAELGATYSELGRPKKTLEHLRAAYEQRLEILSPDDPEALTSMNNLAHALIANGSPPELAEARMLLDKALTIHRARQEGDSPSAITVRSNIARVRLAEGDRAGAEAMTRETLEICRTTYGNDHPSTISQMENLIHLSESQASRETALREILELRERIQGPEHTETLNVRRTLANALTKLERYEEADAIYRDTIQVLSRVAGENHPQTLATQHQRGMCLFRSGRFNESRDLLRETRRREYTHLGDEHPLTLATSSILAEVSFRLGDYAEAARLFQNLAEVHFRLSGPASPRTLLRKQWLGICRLELGQPAEAAQLFDEVSRLSEGMEKPTHLNSVIDIARAKRLWMRDEFGHAESLLLASKQKLQDVYGVSNSHTQLAILYLAQLYDAWGKPEQSARWDRKLKPQR